MFQNKIIMTKYAIALIGCLHLCSCGSTCKKTIGRHVLEVEKENLVCSCSDLKQDTVLSQKIRQVEKGASGYLLGKVLVNKQGQGIYQYVKTGSGIRGNMFMYHNGQTISLLTKENFRSYADSARAVGIGDKEIQKAMPEIEKSISKPPVNTTDSF